MGRERGPGEFGPSGMNMQRANVTGPVPEASRKNRTLLKFILTNVWTSPRQGRSQDRGTSAPGGTGEETLADTEADDGRVFNLERNGATGPWNGCRAQWKTRAKTHGQEFDDSYRRTRYSPFCQASNSVESPSRRAFLA